MSKTKENLMTAFAGESQARNKYTYYAKVARKEGYEYIADLFEETANNEMQHAKDEFKLLDGIKSTIENLKEAISGEDYETSTMYPEFAKIAQEEGNIQAANLFRAIAKVEEKHKKRYERLLKLLEEGNLYKRDKPIKWKCSKCGYVHEGLSAPEICPSCKHPQGYYKPEDVEF